ncbi:CheC domain protein [Alkaliphilus metalliredigens QYMF]|uniref:CheC domain protein n=1 Tax=Alkaliphilus metalliredigens (strain QYMF) TaxID=293826 RepID=A6TJW2_ALKMQ|nr:chemotaxis protein CheX [Alkaliphilus metalliredigens]ABR46480.1 CheC domain protein [Alkaliphilus metalliredigens QYMF]
MEVKYINPFVQSFINIMSQIGFEDPKKIGASVKTSNLNGSGIMVIVGIMGAIKGNVIYGIDEDSAKKIVSTMMGGVEVTELDDMAQSAISELANMLTAHSGIVFSQSEINIDISTPTLMHGSDFQVKASTEKVLCVRMSAGEIQMDINIALH